jgi:acyltransferase-like protein
MPRSYPFVDWMKAIGLMLIVFGHLAHRSVVWIAPPIYLKQFGVTFFVFATGFTLVRETRPVWRVVYQRLFEVFLWGLACALTLSAIGALTGGSLQRSNYLPFALGANLLVNAFPANPTTWYIGTYIHLLLLWALVLRRTRVSLNLLAVVLGAEILIRAVLLVLAGPYVAYMAISNWITVLLLGMFCSQTHERRESPNVRFTIALTACVAAWAVAMHRIAPVPTFPLMSFPLSPDANALAVSFSVSVVYLAVTWLTYQSLNGIADNRFMRLVARNSVIVFVAHMPLYYATGAWVSGVTSSYWARVALRLLFCFVGLLLVSEGLHRLVAVRKLRDRIASMFVEQAARVRVSPGQVREA